VPLIRCSTLDTIQPIIRLLISPSTYFLHRLYLNSTFRRILYAFITPWSTLDTIQLITRLLILSPTYGFPLAQRSMLDTIQLIHRRSIIPSTHSLHRIRCSSLDTIQLTLPLRISLVLYPLRQSFLNTHRRLHYALTLFSILDTIQLIFRLFINST